VADTPARLLRLLSLLQARAFWKGDELADRLQVTPRTLRRDVTRLRDLGYPIDGGPGPYGGYRLGPGGALPPLLLDDDEAVAVAVGLRAATGGAVTGIEESAVAALAKLEQVLPARLRDRVLALNASAVLVRSGAETRIDPEVLLSLAQACRRPERIQFTYVDGSGNVTERRVEPYRLVNVEQRWYLVARDLDRDDWRTFRLDRLTDHRLTGHRFTHGSEPDAATMVVDGLTLGAYRWRAEILVHAPIEDAAREIPPSVGRLDAVDGATVLRMGANELDWIARYLAGLPFAVEVRDPPELRATLRALGRRLQQQHRG